MKPGLGLGVFALVLGLVAASIQIGDWRKGETQNWLLKYSSKVFRRESQPRRFWIFSIVGWALAAFMIVFGCEAIIEIWNR